MNQEKYYGFYRAKVVDNNDPNNFGQIKIWVPAIMTDESLSIWALPANNILGGIDPTESSSYRQGSCVIPYVGSWVWVFFEGGDLGKPFYLTTVNIELVKILPEHQIGTAHKKFTLFKTQQGRVIIFSDDDVDARTEITGKKRLPDSTIEGSTDNVYKIVGNQSTILIDERDGQEKILIKDFHGNAVSIKTSSDEIHVYAKTNIVVKADATVYVQGATGVHVKGQVVNVEADETVNIKAGSMIALDAPKLMEQCGSAQSAQTKQVDVKRNSE